MKYFFCFLLYYGLLQNAHAQELTINEEVKLSYTLKNVLRTVRDIDSIDVIIVLSKNTSTDPLLQGKGRFISAYNPSSIYVYRTVKEQLIKLLTMKSVHFADIAKRPKEELTTGYLDLAPNKINTAHAKYPDIKGYHITASVKEQRFDSTDIDLKGRVIATGVAAPTFTTHAAIMATALGGGGNTSPYAVGAAPGVKLASSSFASLLPDADSVFQHHAITVQNHSYGTVIESYYGPEAAAYDQNVWNNPTLLHVFSAGNSGLDKAPTGVYAGVEAFSNLTGNFKASKNSIAVGATDSFHLVSPASSRGPVEDGRIKPELVAFGEDGSSGAAALVSGTAALIQQAYKDKFNALPTAALVKAVLINSADDRGVEGPDFTTGYGSLNGYEAVKTIIESSIKESQLGQNEWFQIKVTVPDNAANLKVTLVWSDTTGLINKKKALVNDLDLLVRHLPSNESWLPWVLAAAPHTDSILKEAVRKKDTLNNVEQITIQSPVAGDYMIEVKGGTVINRQGFAVAYKIDTLQYFEWTFPTNKDGLTAGKTNVLRWQTNKTTPAVLSYSTNGFDWKELASDIDPAMGYFKWHTPDSLLNAQVRMQYADASTFESDSFVISRPLNLKVGFNCADSFLIFWQNIFSADGYRIYNLGNQYLEPVNTVVDTFLLSVKGGDRSVFYSVAPVVNGKEGIKSFTLNYTAQGADCYFRSFYLQQQNNQRTLFTSVIGSLYNVASISFLKQQGQKFVTLYKIDSPTATTFSFTDSLLTRGINNYRVQLQLNNGRIIYSNEVTAYHFPDDPVMVYPNPASQGSTVYITTNGAGRHIVNFFNINGVLVKTMALQNIVNQIHSVTLPKGLYFIHIINDEGKRSTQKLVIY